jgi:type I restriction enzyme S subunit
MKLEFKEYPAYSGKESDWIGKVPNGWDILPFKRLCSRIEVGIAEATTHAYAETGVPIIRGTNIRPNHIEGEILFIEPWFAEKNSSKYMRSGDLVTVRTGYPGVTAVVPSEFDMSQCFTLIISTPKRGHNSQYYSYFFNSTCGMAHFAVQGWGSAQTNISVPTVQEILVPCPPIEQQLSIVAFLDEETARIDRLMEARQMQISLLTEQRTAVIHHAVTKGIDPHARTKPSGVNWLEDIPADWTVAPLWSLVNFTVSNVDKKSEPLQQSVLLCNYVDVYKNEYISAELAFMEATASAPEIERFSLKENDVIITKDSESPHDIGVPAIVTEAIPSLVCGYHLAFFRTKNTLFPRYLFRLFQTPYIRSFLATKAQGVTRFGLSQNDITRCPVPLPPIAEQRDIIAHIESESARIDTLIAKYRRELELLVEYRASLISHAVTGRIDVGEIATATQVETVGAI